jgi:hypothetical protein
MLLADWLTAIPQGRMMLPADAADVNTESASFNGSAPTQLGIDCIKPKVSSHKKTRTRRVFCKAFQL